MQYSSKVSGQQIEFTKRATLSQKITFLIRCAKIYTFACRKIRSKLLRDIEFIVETIPGDLQLHKVINDKTLLHYFRLVVLLMEIDVHVCLLCM